jgi:putative tricarboxylic transport membrane protein
MKAATPQTLIGLGTLAASAMLMLGAIAIRSDAGYSGVGPSFLPWLVGVALLACGGFLVYESRSGGFREMEDASGAAHGYWPGFLWLTVGILANALLITTIGFILSCTLCFVFAVRGFQAAAGRLDLGWRAWLIDIALGFAIAAPVYWMFTQLLAINLPGLTATGWL